MNLPAIDAHAHIATSVTARQLGQLGSAIIFAMTREPAEAGEALTRSDRNIIWACGAHPAFVAGGADIDLGQFARRVKRFAVVGEIGLDRRAGNLERQTDVFTSILDTIRDEQVLVSIHSAGCTAEVTAVLTRYRLPGTIVHWFNGTSSQVDDLLAAGCYFSVNTAMRREVLDLLPIDRILTETDFPTARKRTGVRPGDVSTIEELLAEKHALAPEALRRRMLVNLRRIAVTSGAIDRLPMHVADTLLMA